VDNEPTGKAKGGLARANSLSGDQRKEIAQAAARARWAGDLPYAVYGSSDRPLRIGALEVPCYVLDNEKRVLTDRGMIAVLGMARGGAGSFSSGQGDRLQRFATGNALSPYISNDLLNAIRNPIPFRVKVHGAGMRRALGYDAEALPGICEAVLQARADGVLHPRQLHIAAQCELIARGLMRVGIIALVDEVTGYQKDRARDALAEILEQFIAKELRPYIRLFPSEFYENLFRLRGLEFPRDSGKKPQYFGHLTNDIVWARLAPGVLGEMRAIVPKRENGKGRKYPFTRRLTEDVGHPKMREHLASVTTIMKLSDQYEDFEVKLDRVHPRYDETLALPLLDKDGEPA
jgi:hypothetical protein